MKKKYKVAFLGGGINSEIGLVHKNALDITQKFSLISGCFSRDSNINKLSGNFFKLPREMIYKNLDQMIENVGTELDAMIILTPTNQHFDNIKKIMHNKIPIISEKSLVTSMKEINELKKLRNNSKSFLVITYNYTGYPMIREIQDFIKRGCLGNIFNFLIEMPQDSFIRLNKNNNKINIKKWRLKKYKIPMIFYDLGMHVHSLIEFLLNSQIKKVLCKTNQFGNFKTIDDNVHCLIELKNKSIGNIWFSKSALGFNNGLKIRIFGQKGSIEWYQENPDQFWFCDRYGRRNLINQSSAELNISNQKRYQRFKPGHPSGFLEAFANYYDDIADSLSRKKKLSTFSLGLDTAENGIKFVESAFSSSKINNWVKL